VHRICVPQNAPGAVPAIVVIALAMKPLCRLQGNPSCPLFQVTLVSLQLYLGD